MGRNTTHASHDDSFGQIRRFTEADFPDYGPRLLDRLREKWPAISQIQGRNSTNEFLFSATTSRSA